MTRQRDDTNGFWLFLQIAIVVLLAVGIVAYTRDYVSWKWNSLTTSNSRPPLELRVETLETRVSKLSNEVTNLQATATILDDSTPTPNSAPNPIPIPSSYSQVLIVIVENANVRAGPSTEYPVLDGVQKDQILEGPFEMQSGWYRFCCVKGDQHGWIAGDLVKVQDQSSTSSSRKTETKTETKTEIQTESNHPSITSPPRSLGVTPIYQKYMKADGVHILALADVSDKAMIQARDILFGMVSTRPDLFAAMTGTGLRIIIYNHRTTSLPQLPEFKEWPLASQRTGGFAKDSSGYTIAAPEIDIQCSPILIHEIAHAIDYVAQSLDSQFSARRDVAYQNAMAAGLWTGEYAATDKFEYWAVAVEHWFRPRAFTVKISSYDPEAAKLVKSVFVNAQLPNASCR